jgi:hypothetical protein
MEKLDRLLMNNECEALYPLTNLRKIPIYMSDHNPLLLSTEQEKMKKQKQFCFETAWIKQEDFLPKIKEIWEKPVTAKMQQTSGILN